MILWILLFFLVVAISFVLAAKSMKDFTQVPHEEEYSLFLIRKLKHLDTNLLESIKKHLAKQNLLLSFERLFKGNQSALVVYGPKHLLLGYKDTLDLLELDDYTNVDSSTVSAWEMGIKNSQEIFKRLPQLHDDEQFFWQVIISGKFNPQITAVVISQDPLRRHTLSSSFQNLAPQRVFKLPKAFSNTQLLDFYKIRSLRGGNTNPSLNTLEFLQLVLL